MAEQNKALERLGSHFTKFLCAVGVVLIVIEFFIHRHGEFAFEDMFLFPAIYGFLAFLFIVQIGKWLRLVIMRDQDYYDE